MQAETASPTGSGRAAAARAAIRAVGRPAAQRRSCWRWPSSSSAAALVRGPGVRRLLDLPHLAPDSWTLRWWGDVFKDPNLLGTVRLSFHFALTTVVVSAVICLPAAYAFSRFEFPGRRTFFVGLLAANAFPRIGLYVAIASLFYRFNLMGTFSGVVLVQLVGTVVL